MGKRSVSKGIIREICDEDVYGILNGNISRFKEDNPLEYNELIINGYINEIDNGTYGITNPDTECQATIGFILSFFSKNLSNELLLDRYYWRSSEYKSGFRTSCVNKFPKLLKELERIWGLVFDRNRFYLLDRKGVTLP